MAQMRGRSKTFGRCPVQGHGQRCYCELCQEIQSKPMTRSKEKSEWKKEMKHLLNVDQQTESKEHD